MRERRIPATVFAVALATAFGLVPGGCSGAPASDDAGSNGSAGGGDGAVDPDTEPDAGHPADGAKRTNDDAGVDRSRDAGGVGDAETAAIDRPTVGGGQAFVSANPDKAFCDAPEGSTVVEPGTSGEEFKSLVEAAGSGDVIYVAPDAEIELDFTADEGEEVEIPAGVTIASDRGCGGAAGGMLDMTDGTDEDVDQGAQMLMVTGSNVVIAGLRLDGPGHRMTEDPEPRDHEGEGVEIESGSNIEIYNNAVTNFPKTCLDGGNGEDIHIHHNRITFCNTLGYGYGVDTTNDNPILVEYNYFNHYRHAISAAADRYVFRYNHVGPERQNHMVDNHIRAEWMEIYCNSLIGDKETYTDTNQALIDWRDGTSHDTSYVTGNWFVPASNAVRIGDGEYEANSDDEDIPNLVLENNHYAEDEPGCDVGAPREGCTGEYACEPPDGARSG